MGKIENSEKHFDLKSHIEERAKEKKVTVQEYLELVINGLEEYEIIFHKRSLHKGLVFNSSGAEPECETGFR